MIQTISSVIAAVGVSLAVLGLRQAQLQRLRQFEAFYVKRYWDLMDRLSLSALREEQRDDIEEGDERTIRSYFRLCEDQLELRKSGWISDETWKIWAEGMSAQVGRPPFNGLWAVVKATEAETPNPRYALLNEFVSSAGSFDPCAVSRWTAIGRGLKSGPG